MVGEYMRSKVGEFADSAFAISECLLRLLSLRLSSRFDTGTVQIASAPLF